jgi:hypothetical protein
MANQMDKSNSDLGGLQAQLLGPDYDYSAQITPPQGMGMSSAGNFTALGNDIGGLFSYVKVLITGQGAASRTGKPLGTKFFLPTPVQCKDKATGNDVTRSIYINNVPDGSIPFISQGMGGNGVTFDDFRGLVPGLMSNLAQINPLQILQAFTAGSSPTCQAITMETIDSNNKSSMATGYVTNTDIELMNIGWFPNRVKPDTSEPDEGFTNMQATTSLINENVNYDKVNYGKMPNDFLIRLYYTSLGVIGLYFFLKMILKPRMKIVPDSK